MLFVFSFVKNCSAVTANEILSFFIGPGQLNKFQFFMGTGLASLTKQILVFLWGLAWPVKKLSCFSRGLGLTSSKVVSFVMEPGQLKNVSSFLKGFFLAILKIVSFFVSQPGQFKTFLAFYGSWPGQLKTCYFSYFKGPILASSKTVISLI